MHADFAPSLRVLFTFDTIKAYSFDKYVSITIIESSGCKSCSRYSIGN